MLLRGSTALALLARAHEIDADLPVVLVEQTPTLATATAGLRLGASDYLTGPPVRGRFGGRCPAAVGRAAAGSRV